MRWEPKFIFWIGLLRSKLTLTKDRRLQDMETAAKRVPIFAGYLIGLIERDEALFAFAKGRGSSIMTITCANPEMYSHCSSVSRII